MLFFLLLSQAVHIHSDQFLYKSEPSLLFALEGFLSFFFFLALSTESRTEALESLQSSCCGINQYLKYTVAIFLPLKVGLCVLNFLFS